MSHDNDRQWRDQGFDSATQQGFQSWKIDLATAIQWRAAGVQDGLTAVRWKLAGATPPQSSAWRAAGFDSVEALQWHQTGHNLLSATDAKRRGLKPSPDTSGSHRAGSSGRPNLVPHLESMRADRWGRRSLRG